jgi:hypothetical protein
MSSFWHSALRAGVTAWPARRSSRQLARGAQEVDDQREADRVRRGVVSVEDSPERSTLGIVEEVADDEPEVVLDVEVAPDGIREHYEDEERRERPTARATPEQTA